MIRVTRGYHSAWVPEGQNTKIVLFGGDEKEAVGTADVVGGGSNGTNLGRYQFVKIDESVSHTNLDPLKFVRNRFPGQSYKNNSCWG